MLLNSGEQIVHQGYVGRYPDGELGLLVLTNFRLVFEVSSDAGARVMDLDLYLPYLLDAQVQDDGTPHAVLLLAFPGGYRQFVTPHAEAWRKLVVHYRATVQRTGRAPTPPPTAASPIGASVASTRAAAPAVAAAPTVLLRCRQCGGLSSQTSTRCERCGAPI
ncbi:MAG TPA: hypothetical protein VGV64_03965 [Thermoplasmata archaeon]|nr:hypothetical protein [Thermoplasmata archaeon]